MAATFSITLDKNFRLDTGRKLEKISKSRDGFFSRGDNTALCAVEQVIEKSYFLHRGTITFSDVTKLFSLEN